MRPDLRQLQALVAVARHGTLGRAADALHCSPSSVSMQLGALQRALGTTVLRRTGRGLVLTEEGERLLPAARAAVEAVDALMRQADPAAAERAAWPVLPSQPVVLGTILDPDAIRLGQFLRAARQRAPQVHPDLRHGISGGVLKGVREGQLDLGFCLGQTHEDGEAEDLRVQRLATVRYVVVAPRGWQARLQGRSWAELAELPWIDTPADSVHRRLLGPLFQRLGRRMQTVARVDQEASMLDLVRAGFGLSLAREAVALREADESGLALWRQQPLATSLSLVARAPPQPAEQAAVDAVSDAVSALFDVAAQVWPHGG